MGILSPYMVRSAIITRSYCIYGTLNSTCQLAGTYSILVLISPCLSCLEPLLYFTDLFITSYYRHPLADAVTSKSADVDVISLESITDYAWGEAAGQIASGRTTAEVAEELKKKLHSVIFT